MPKKFKFVSATSVAKFLGVDPAGELESLKLHNHIPSSCVVVDGESYWLLADIDELFSSIIRNWLEAQS